MAKQVSSQLGAELPEVNVDAFGFKELSDDTAVQLFAQKWDENQLPSTHARLLATCSLPGKRLIVAAGPDAVYLYSSEEVLDILREGPQTKDDATIHILNPPSPIARLEHTNTHYVSFSANGQYLFVVSNRTRFVVYSIDSLQYPSDKSSLGGFTSQVELNNFNYGNGIVEIIPNPGDEQKLAVTFEAAPGKCRVGIISFASQGWAGLDRDILAFCWSTAGKQFMVATEDGSLNTFTTDLVPKMTIAPNPDQVTNRFAITDLLWLSNTSALVTYSAPLEGAPNEWESKFFTVNFLGDSPASYNANPDATIIPMAPKYSRTPPRHYFSRIRRFHNLLDLVVVSSPNESEMKFFGSYEAGDYKQLSMSNDNYIAPAIPMDSRVSDDDTYVIGTSFDYTSRVAVPVPIEGVDWDELENVAPHPAYLCLNHLGWLKGWWAVNCDAIIAQKAHPAIEMNMKANEILTSSQMASRKTSVSQDKTSQAVSSAFSGGGATSSPFAMMSTNAQTKSFMSPSKPFGTGASPSPFGNPNSQPSAVAIGFGSLSISGPTAPGGAFGITTGGPSPFGKAPSADSPFGNPASTSSPFGMAPSTDSPFGKAPSTNSPFGNLLSTGSAFGVAPTSTSSSFGVVSGGKPSTATGVFGASSQQATDSTKNAFGILSTSKLGSFGITPPAGQGAGVYGSTFQATPGTGAFGTGSSSASTVFGIKPGATKSTPATGAFGTGPSSASAVFGIKPDATKPAAASTIASAFTSKKEVSSTTGVAAPFGITSEANKSSSTSGFGFAAKSNMSSAQSVFGMGSLSMSDGTKSGTENKEAPTSATATDSVSKASGPGSAESQARAGLSMEQSSSTSVPSGAFSKIPVPTNPFSTTPAKGAGPGSMFSSTPQKAPGKSDGFSLDMLGSALMGSTLSKKDEPSSRVTEIKDDTPEASTKDPVEGAGSESDTGAGSFTVISATGLNGEFEEDGDVDGSKEEEKEEEKEGQERGQEKEDEEDEKEEGDEKEKDKKEDEDEESESSESSEDDLPPRLTREEKGKGKAMYFDSDEERVREVDEDELSESFVEDTPVRAPGRANRPLESDTPLPPDRNQFYDSQTPSQPPPAESGHMFFPPSDTPVRERPALAFGQRSPLSRSTASSRPFTSFYEQTARETQAVKDILSAGPQPTVKMPKFEAYSQMPVIPPSRKDAGQTEEDFGEKIEVMAYDTNNMIDTLNINIKKLSDWVAGNASRPEILTPTTSQLERNLDADWADLETGSPSYSGWVLDDLHEMGALKRELHEMVLWRQPTNLEEQLQVLRALRRQIDRLPRALQDAKAVSDRVSRNETPDPVAGARIEQTLSSEQESIISNIRTEITELHTCIAKAKALLSSAQIGANNLSSRVFNQQGLSSESVENLLRRLIGMADSRLGDLTQLLSTAEEIKAAIRAEEEEESDDDDGSVADSLEGFDGFGHSSLLKSVRKTAILTTFDSDDDSEPEIHTGEDGVFSFGFGSGPQTSALRQSLRLSRPGPGPGPVGGTEGKARSELVARMPISRRARGVRARQRQDKLAAVEEILLQTMAQLQED